MEGLLEQFAYILRDVNHKHKRYLYELIDWSRKLVIIKGTRKVGKTTLALQYVKESYGLSGKVLYVRSDNMYFSENTLLDLAEEFEKRDGFLLILDEFHKYPYESRDVKEVLNKFENLRLVLIGSSAYDYSALKPPKDLVGEYILYGLSFREFLKFNDTFDGDIIDSEQIVKEHSGIASEMSRNFDPVMHFKSYLEYGYYPFYRENRRGTAIIAQDIFNSILENDLVYAKSVKIDNVHGIKKMLELSFKGHDNINPGSIAKEVGFGRGTVLQYFNYLDEAGLIFAYKPEEKSGKVSLSKPSVIYPANTVLSKVMFYRKNSQRFVNESFFISQLRVSNQIRVGGRPTFFEINGKYKFLLSDPKPNAQKKILSSVKPVYQVVDDIEIGIGSKIPLWIFGFMY